MTENTQELNKSELVLQAFQERIAQIVVEYESKIADIRAEYTILNSAFDALQNRLRELERPTDVPQEAPAPTE